MDGGDRSLVGYRPDAVGTLLTPPGRPLGADGCRLGVGLDYSGVNERTWSIRWRGERRGEYADSGLLLRFDARF